MSSVFKPGVKAAKRAARTQREQIARQTQIEQARLAEEESEIAKRRFATQAGRGGRSLLTAAAPTGEAKTLGG